MSKVAPETDILTPHSASRDLDSDEWPEFELTNSTVHLPGDNKALVSLLDATENNALVVNGQLEPLPKHLTNLLKKPSALKRTECIQLSAVRLYAYGQYSDGSIAIWAAGQSGWFCLKPGRAYRKVYNDMIEAIETLYFIADAYKEERKTPAGKKRQPPSSKMYSAQNIFEKYAAAKLHDEARTVEAAQRIYRHKDFLFLSMIVGKEGVAWTNTPFWRHLVAKFPAEYANVKVRLGAQHVEHGATTTTAPRMTMTDSASSESGSLKRKRGRPSKHKASDVISIGSSTATSSRSKDNAAEPSKNRKASKVAASMHQKHGPGEHSTSTNDPTAMSEDEATTTPVQDSEDEIPRRAHKGKSILRPKPAKSSKSSKMRRRVPVDEDEGNDEDRGNATPGSPTVGKQINQINIEDHGRRRKRRSNRLDPEDEGIDIPSSHSESGSGPMSPQSLADPIKSPSDVLHELDPLQEDTWVCALDGCTHKVYLASEPESQRLIREHYALHAYDDDERVQMVKRLKAPSLPVSHLMERVRLQAKNEGFPSSRGGVMGPAGDRFPTITALPVMQRY